jgi:hypothetical protein
LAAVERVLTAGLGMGKNTMTMPAFDPVPIAADGPWQ